jgi:hypothetical protein
VRLVLQIKKDAVLVPSQSVQVGQDGPFLYVLKGREQPDAAKPAMATADQRPIKPGQLQGDLIVIERGVGAGEEVIVTGQMAIGPGAKVQVLPPLGSGGAGAPGAAPSAGGGSEQHTDSPATKPATPGSEGGNKGNGAATGPAAEGKVQS